MELIELAQQTINKINNGEVVKQSKKDMVDNYIKMITFRGYVEVDDTQKKRLLTLSKKELINLLRYTAVNLLQEQSYKNIVV